MQIDAAPLIASEMLHVCVLLICLEHREDIEKCTTLATPDAVWYASSQKVHVCGVFVDFMLQELLDGPKHRINALLAD